MTLVFRLHPGGSEYSVFCRFQTIQQTALSSRRPSFGLPPHRCPVKPGHPTRLLRLRSESHDAPLPVKLELEPRRRARLPTILPKVV